MGSERSETFEIISLTNMENRAEIQYFNSTGESGIITSEITDNDFRIHGEGIKFCGTINDKIRKLSANGYCRRLIKIGKNLLT